jgi:hypothetical protein
MRTTTQKLRLDVRSSTSTIHAVYRDRIIQQRPVRPQSPYEHTISIMISITSTSTFLAGRPQLLHDVVRDSLQPFLGGRRPRRLTQISLPRNTETCNHLTRQDHNLPFDKGFRASNEVLEGWDDKRCWYRVFFGEGNPRDGVKRNTALEYLSPRAVFSFCKSESMGDAEQGYPFPDGH